MGRSENMAEKQIKTDYKKKKKNPPNSASQKFCLLPVNICVTFQQA